MNLQLWLVLNWNIRGINDETKWPLISNKIEESKAHIVCFQETKREHFDLAYLNKIFPRRFDSFCFLPSVGRSGGLLTVWCTNMFSGELLFQNEFALSVEFTSVQSNEIFVVTNIYGPCQHDRKQLFLNWFHDIIMDPEVNCLIVGDFNLI